MVCNSIVIGRLNFCFIVTGVLKGFDQLLNLVLDDVEEEASGA